MSADFDEKVLYDVCKWMRNDQMIISTSQSILG